MARLLYFSLANEALQASANKSPDRWAQALSILGKLSGVTDKDNEALQFNFKREIEGMSIFERKRLLAKYEAKMIEIVANSCGIGRKHCYS
jgi:hypothetical protein